MSLGRVAANNIIFIAHQDGRHCVIDRLRSVPMHFRSSHHIAVRL